LIIENKARNTICSF